MAQSGPEWDKFIHVKAYAHEGDNSRKWYALYTTNPCNLKTNVSSAAFMHRETLFSLEDAQTFESVFKMTRTTFRYICSLKGDLLNGSKLKIALDGSEVGEHIIGDVEYPLLPWLLTPYREEELSDSKVEFNRRHSAATTCTLNNVLARFKVQTHGSTCKRRHGGRSIRTLWVT
uniref:DDE Tnp4 domain-containing protein n=1 Tax=Aegilops tauschii TaxID=37682 RepID=M8BH27_AEGTA